VSLVTARDDKDLKRQLVQEAFDTMPHATYEEMVEVAKMYAATALMLTSYVAGLATVVGDGVDDRLRATIRVELLEDL
jgi:ribonuclease BN (tRNA processing enzyme)